MGESVVVGSVYFTWESKHSELAGVVNVDRITIKYVEIENIVLNSFTFFLLSVSFVNIKDSPEALFIFLYLVNFLDIGLHWVKQPIEDL